MHARELDEFYPDRERAACDALHRQTIQSVCSREKGSKRRAKARADAACGNGRVPDQKCGAGKGTCRSAFKERCDELRSLKSLALLRRSALRSCCDTGTPCQLKVRAVAPCMSDACGRCLRCTPEARHAYPRMFYTSTVCV